MLCLMKINTNSLKTKKLEKTSMDIYRYSLKRLLMSINKERFFHEFKFDF